MKRHKGILVASAVVGVAIAVVWPSEKEPVYNGRKLSQWLVVYEQKYSIDLHNQNPKSIIQKLFAYFDYFVVHVPRLTP